MLSPKFRNKNRYFFLGDPIVNHLVITVGQSDLQVAWETGGSRTLHKLEKDSVRVFHQALISKDVPFTVVRFNETTEWTEKRPFLNYQPETKSLGQLPGVGQIDASTGIRLAAPLISKLLTDDRIRGVKFQSAFILDTWRNSGSGEPVAVFHVLAQHIANALNIPLAKVSRTSFLIGDETQDEEDETGQKFLLPAASRRIDTAIRSLLSATGKKTLYISDSGGLPSVKPVLEASARLRADEVRFVSPVEEGPANRPIRPIIVVGPAESLNIRRLARMMIIRGGFAEAAALIKTGDPATSKLAEKQEPWRSWLRQTAVALRGGDFQDSNLPGKTPPLLKRIRKLGPLVWTAFRLESALRSGDIRDAFCAHFTFIDIAAHLIHTKLCNKDRPSDSPVWELSKSWPDSPIKVTYDSFYNASSLQKNVRNQIMHGWAKESDVKNSLSKFYEYQLWQNNPPSFLSQSIGTKLIEMVTDDSGSIAKLYQDLVDALLSDMDEFSLLDAPQRE